MVVFLVQGLEQAMKLNPARMDVRRALIYAMVQQKEWERAERELKDYRAFAPNDLAEVRGWLKR